MNETPENSNIEEAPEEQGVNAAPADSGEAGEAPGPGAATATSDESPEIPEREYPGTTADDTATAEDADTVEGADTAEATDTADGSDSDESEDAPEEAAAADSDEAFDFHGSFADEGESDETDLPGTGEDEGIDLQALEASGLFNESPGSEKAEVRAQPARFQELDDLINSSSRADIDMLLDISLPMVVELGRTKMLIEEILSLKSGSVVTLDKLTGEPANLVINGKVMATGEIVVIDENFGIRITNLVKPMDRLKAEK